MIRQIPPFPWWIRSCMIEWIIVVFCAVAILGVGELQRYLDRPAHTVLSRSR